MSKCFEDRVVDLERAAKAVQAEADALHDLCDGMVARDDAYAFEGALMDAHNHAADAAEALGFAIAMLKRRDEVAA